MIKTHLLHSNLVPLLCERYTFVCVCEFRFISSKHPLAMNFNNRISLCGVRNDYLNYSNSSPYLCENNEKAYLYLRTHSHINTLTHFRYGNAHKDPWWCIYMYVVCVYVWKCLKKFKSTGLKSWTKPNFERCFVFIFFFLFIACSFRITFMNMKF